MQFRLILYHRVCIAKYFLIRYAPYSYFTEVSRSMRDVQRTPGSIVLAYHCMRHNGHHHATHIQFVSPCYPYLDLMRLLFGRPCNSASSCIRVASQIVALAQLTVEPHDTHSKLSPSLASEYDNLHIPCVISCAQIFS